MQTCTMTLVSHENDGVWHIDEACTYAGGSQRHPLGHSCCLVGLTRLRLQVTPPHGCLRADQSEASMSLMSLHLLGPPSACAYAEGPDATIASMRLGFDPLCQQPLVTLSCMA